MCDKRYLFIHLYLDVGITVPSHDKVNAFVSDTKVFDKIFVKFKS